MVVRWLPVSTVLRGVYDAYVPRTDIRTGGKLVKGKVNGTVTITVTVLTMGISCGKQVP